MAHDLLILNKIAAHDLLLLNHIAWVLYIIRTYSTGPFHQKKNISTPFDFYIPGRETLEKNSSSPFYLKNI